MMKEKNQNPNAGIIVLLIIIATIMFLANFNAVLEPVKSFNKIILPISIGMILAFILNPVLNFFESKLFKQLNNSVIRRILSLFLTYICLVGVIVGFFAIVIPQLSNSIQDFSKNGMGHVEDLLIGVRRLVSNISFIKIDVNYITFENILTKAVGLFDKYKDSIFNFATDFVVSFFGVITDILVGIIISIYILMSKEKLGAICRRACKAFLSSKTYFVFFKYLTQINKKFSQYITGSIVDCISMGLCCGIIFAIFRIPYAPLLAVILGCTNIIPFFGPFIGGIPGAIIVFIADPGKLVLFIILNIVIQQIEGNIIAPKILGGSIGVSSLGVLVAITIFGGIFGPIGMIIGTPLTAVILTIFDDIVVEKLNQRNEKARLDDYLPKRVLPEHTNPEDKLIFKIKNKILKLFKRNKK